MSEINVITFGSELVVDSRLIAKELDISHKTLVETIRKYLTELQGFGQLPVQQETVTNSVGAKNTVVFYYLNENQATLLMTFSRNTTKVVQCKVNLVKSFSRAKDLLSPQQSYDPHPVTPTLEDIRLDKQIELERLRLSNNQLDNTMLQLHGKETVLLLRGLKENVVTVENTVTEVVDVRSNYTEKILSAEQLTSTIKKKTGQKPASNKWVVDTVKKLGRSDLIATVNRSVSGEYVKSDCVDEVIDLIYGQERQRLIGE